MGLEQKSMLISRKNRYRQISRRAKLSNSITYAFVIHPDTPRKHQSIHRAAAS